MIELEQPTLFNYASLDGETTVYLKQNAQETRTLLKRTSDDIIQIGKNLLEAKATLPHGQFIPWVKSEIGISQQTSWRFMQIAQGKAVKSLTVSDLVVLPPVERAETGDGLVKLRSPKDVIKQFFTDFPNLHSLSNVEIAKRTGTTEGTVRKLRKELFPEPTPAKEVNTVLIDETEPEQEEVESTLEELSGPTDILAPEIENVPEPEPEPEIVPVPTPPAPKLPKIEPC